MPDARTIDRNNHGRSATRALDWELADLARRQHGVVSRTQLLRAGFSGDGLDWKVATNRLHVVHHGVYAVGHRALSPDGRRMAAALAGGPETVLSHRAAGTAWGLISSEYLEITAPSRRTRPGIRIHRSHLQPDEVTTLRAIPITGVSRTVLDLSGVLRPHQLERAVNEVEVLGLTDSLSLPDLIARYPRRKGVKALKAIFEIGPAVTRSELEARFTAFAREAGLPSPLLNARVLNYECDCVWPDHGLVAELDGHAFHRTREAFERDRVRDRALQVAGWQVVRITWRQLGSDPVALARDLRRMLGTRAPRRGRARAAGP